MHYHLVIFFQEKIAYHLAIAIKRSMISHTRVKLQSRSFIKALIAKKMGEHQGPIVIANTI